MKNPPLHNPHLRGEPFFWQGGQVGVMLSNGYTATTAEVRLLAEKLHTAGYSVAGPLLPGHGTVPTDLNCTPWQAWVEAGEQAYQQLQTCCQTIFVGGESMGALVALQLASQHPQVAGVLAYAPVMRLPLNPPTRLALRLLAPFIPWVPKASLDASHNWQGYPVNPLKGVLQLLAFQKALYRRLPLIHQPMLVVQGRLDTTIHPASGAIILGAVSSTCQELYWMEKSSHVVLLDQELDEITRLTLQFIEKVVSSRG